MENDLQSPDTVLDSATAAAAGESDLTNKDYVTPSNQKRCQWTYAQQTKISEPNAALS